MQPVFIGGVGRSGTTLLADVLGFHSEVSPIYETGFVAQLLRFIGRPTPHDKLSWTVRDLMDRRTRDLPHMPHNKREYERYFHGPHHLLFSRQFALERTEVFLQEITAVPKGLALRRFVSDLFAEHCRVAGKPRWVNKVPAYIHYADLLRAVFPDLLLIHIVRDGRDVAASLLTRPWGPSTAEEAIRLWVTGLGTARAFAAKHPGQMVEIRYEDLLRNPDSTLNTAFAGMGLNLPADLVQRYQAAVGSFDGSRIGKGRGALTAKDLDAIAAVAGPTLQAYGYGTDDLVTTA